NARKRREWAIVRAYRESARADAAPVTVQEAPRNGRSAPIAPDLAAAIAEVSEMHRPPPPRDREPARAAIPPDPEHPNAALPCSPFPAHPAIPCTSCTHPNAAAALREVLDRYVAACRGEPHQTGSALPRACCQRLRLRRPDVRAMIA